MSADWQSAQLGTNRVYFLFSDTKHSLLSQSGPLSCQSRKEKFRLI